MRRVGYEILFLLEQQGASSVFRTSLANEYRKSGIVNASLLELRRFGFYVGTAMKLARGSVLFFDSFRSLRISGDYPIAEGQTVATTEDEASIHMSSARHSTPILLSWISAIYNYYCFVFATVSKATRVGVQTVFV